MKKFYYLVSVLALASLVGCQNEDDVFGSTSEKSVLTVTASLEEETSRTALTTGNKVVWEEGDELSLFLGSTKMNKGTLASGANTTYAEFKVTAGSDIILGGGTESDGSGSFANVAYYPYTAEGLSVAKDGDNYVITTSLPATQVFKDASFSKGSSHTVSVTENFAFSFKSVGCLFKLPIKGSATIVRATLESKATEENEANKLAGACTITSSVNGTPTLVMDESASSLLTLDCGEEGVQLGDSTVFVFVVPPATYNGGTMTFTLYDNKGGYMTFTPQSTYQLNRGDSQPFKLREYVAGGETINEANLIQEAIDAGQATYSLMSDLTMTAGDTIKVPAGVEFTLDLNGKTLNGQGITDATVPDYLDNYGTMTITNGKIVSANNIESRRCIYNREGATMTIDNVEFVQTYETKGAAINNAGTMTIENATVDSKYFSIWNEKNGDLTINGGTYNCNSYTEDNESESGQTFSYAVYNTGGAKLTINGGTFNCTHGFATLAYGSETVINYCEVNWVGQYDITTCAFDVYGAETKLTVNDCKVNWREDEGSSILRLNEGVTASNVKIIGGLYNHNTVTNSTGDEFVVKFVDSGNETYPYKAIDAGYKAVEGGYEIYNAYGLKWFAEQVNDGESFSGKTVTLTADVNLGGEEWTPIGDMNAKNYFSGTFDGNGKTVSNFKVNVDDNAAGFFGAVQNCVEIKNLTIIKATINSNRMAGAVVGFFQENGNNGKVPVVSGCTVKQSTITVVPNSIDSGFDNGDKAGSIVGYAASDVKIDACTTYDVTVTGYRDLGGIVGMANSSEHGTVTITNCKVMATTITYSATNAYKDETPTTFGEIYGRGSANCSGNTTSKVTINWPEDVTILVNGKGYTSLESAVADVEENTVIEVPAGEYTLPTFNNAITLNCAEGTVFTGQSSLNVNGSTIIGATFSNEESSSSAVKGSINGTFKNCTFTGTSNALRSCYAGETVVFEGCTFTGQTYGVHFDGVAGDVANPTLSFTDCEFTGWNSFARTITKITMDNCKFHKSNYGRLRFYQNADVANSTFDTAYDSIDFGVEGSESLGITVNFTSTTLTDGNLIAIITEGTNNVVNIDNVKVLPSYLETEDGAEIYNARGLNWFANQVNTEGNTFFGKTVKLMDNIDLNNAAWTPIGQTGATQFNGTFDGNGKTISNLNIPAVLGGENYATGLFGWTENGTIKKLNINKATVSGYHLCAAVIGYISGPVTVEECNVTSATITCSYGNEKSDGDKAACIVGQIGGDEAYVKVCTASQSTVTAGRDAGQIVGAALNDMSNNVIDCSATEVTVKHSGETDTTGANINNALIGRTN